MKILACVFGVSSDRCKSSRGLTRCSNIINVSLLEQSKDTFFCLSDSSEIPCDLSVFIFAEVNNFSDFVFEVILFLGLDGVADSALRDIVVGRSLNIEGTAILDEPLSFSFQLFSNGVVSLIGSVGHLTILYYLQMTKRKLNLYELSKIRKNKVGFPKEGKCWETFRQKNLQEVREMVLLYLRKV